MALLFTEYYKGLGILGEDEWDKFVEALETPLPITFRILANTIHHKWVTEFLQACEKTLQDIKDEFVFAPLAWYPGGSAWELKASRQVLRSHERLKDLSQFLIRQSENGVIIRQEAVSMVPALFLIQDIKSDDAILLDLCAAPGSKTSQLLEALEMARSPDDIAAGLPPRGAVVANDIKPSRAHMLCHHLKYQWSPSLVVTLHNAALYPRLFTTDENGKQKVVKYDGVLCDVPCSGDGTIRKAPRIWKTWDTKGAIALHRLQMRILKKGISLCRVGSRIVYSTCSMNPIEDEAVVAGVLRHSEGCVQVEKVSLDGLKARPGMTNWHVAWRKDSIYNKWEDVPEKLQKSKLWPSMFPPVDDEADLKAALMRCHRYYPHDNDTGGFFVCVLRKVKEVPWEDGRPSRRVLGDEQVNKDDISEEESESPVETKMRKCEGDVVTPTALASVRQKDVIGLLEDAQLRADFSSNCLLRYGLPESETLLKLLWYRPMAEEASDKDKSRKRDRHGGTKNILQENRIAAEENTVAIRDNAEPATKHPRKILFASERASELMRAFTIRCAHRVANVGTAFADMKPGQSAKVTPAGFRMARALLERYEPGYQFKLSSAFIEISKETMREIFRIAEQESTGTQELTEAQELMTTEEDASKKDECDKSQTLGVACPIDQLQDKENTKASGVQESPSANGADALNDLETSSTLLKKEEHKSLANRFNFMTLPEDSVIRKTMTAVEKEGHYLLIIKIESETLYVPIYVGKRNADLLVTDSVRRSLINLLT